MDSNTLSTQVNQIGQIASTTGNVAMAQAKIYGSILFENMQTYWQYWTIGFLVFYIIMWCGKKTEGFYNINWDNLGSSFQSFGRTNVLARLNDAVWKGAGKDCYPNGEYYVMRYTMEPKGCIHTAGAPKPVHKGYYNACGKALNSF